VCVNGRCKQRCEGVVCGIGAVCDTATEKCVCEPYFVGNPELLCMPRKHNLYIQYYGKQIFDQSFLTKLQQLLCQAVIQCAEKMLIVNMV